MDSKLAQAITHWVALLLGVWLVDLGLDMVTLGFGNTLLVALGLSVVFGILRIGIERDTKKIVRGF